MFAFTSCNPDKAQCWNLQITDEDNKVTEYLFYGTGDSAPHASTLRSECTPLALVPRGKAPPCRLGGVNNFKDRMGANTKCLFVTPLIYMPEAL